MLIMRVACILSIFYVTACASPASTLVKDGATTLSLEEVEFIVSQWPKQMQQAAAADVGDSIELLNRAIVTKKMAADAEKYANEADNELYWKHKFAIRNTQQEFVYSRYLGSVDIPNMEDLAAERYLTDKEKYAAVPETRLSSHILILCAEGDCRRQARDTAEKVLAKLRAGANFEAMVEQYSTDPNAKRNKGKFDKWIRKGEPHVAPPFVGGVFSVEEVGGYSEVVGTQFGYHVIRLDGIREAHYKSYDEVKDTIVQALQGEYIALVAKDFEAQYRLSDDASINFEALEEILAPYRMPQPLEESEEVTDIVEEVSEAEAQKEAAGGAK